MSVINREETDTQTDVSLLLSIYLFKAATH